MLGASRAQQWVRLSELQGKVYGWGGAKMHGLVRLVAKGDGGNLEEGRSWST